MMNRLFIFALCFLSACSTLRGTYNLSEQNDFFAANNKDKNYTQGVFLKYREPEVESYKEFELGQMIYTPDHKKIVPPIESENPYAALLFVSGEQFFEHSDYRTSYKVLTGLVGPHAYGEQVQNGFHKLIGNGDAKGWDYQLKDEPILNVSHKREWVNFEKTFRGLEFNSLSSVESRVGNLHLDFIFSNGFKLGKNVPRYDFSKSRRSVYLFSNFSNHFVSHNIFYDGNTFKDSPRVTSTKTVLFLDSGIGVEYKKLRFKFHYLLNTREYDEQKSWFHNYGWLDFSLIF